MRFVRRYATVVCFAVIVAIGISALPIRAEEKASLEKRVKKLEKRIEKLEAILEHVSVSDEAIEGVAGPHVIFEGCNVHVRSGSGSTSDGAKGGTLGLGNLIIGYNDEPVLSDTNRGGSHNFIVGDGHNYPSYGCVVFGGENSVLAQFSTITGGYQNTASGTTASVSGGHDNTAEGLAASVTGGAYNDATKEASSVSGGSNNVANGEFATVSGGASRSAGIGGFPGGEYDWAAGSLYEGS